MVLSAERMFVQKKVIHVSHNDHVELFGSWPYANKTARI
jgi:hypothetical protein